ncbi:MAG: SGNH/GDSL hydrolase family protein [Limisphaerales bacterium]
MVILFAGIVAGGYAHFAHAQPAPPATESSELVWTDARTLTLEGRGWTNTKCSFDRLPASAEGVVRPEVWNLSRHSAGLAVRFVTDATAISARWRLTSPNLALPNMAAIGVSGLDLYVRDGKSGWRWAGFGAPRAVTNTAMLVSGLPPGQREFLLYLPLYNGVMSLELGVASNAALRPAGPWGPGRRKPIVFYGTSITQGASASRPGMCHVAMLGRRFNRPTINLGFSGQGRMEPELATLLTELAPAVFVLDCLPNMNAAGVRERVVPFVKTLRAAHPVTPIVLVEDRVNANTVLLPQRAAHHRANHEALRAAYQQLRREGVRHLHYVKGDGLLGRDGEGTVDGSHPNELGFTRQAEALARALRPLLSHGNPRRRRPD